MQSIHKYGIVSMLWTYLLGLVWFNRVRISVRVRVRFSFGDRVGVRLADVEWVGSESQHVGNLKTYIPLLSHKQRPSAYNLSMDVASCSNFSHFTWTFSEPLRKSRRGPGGFSQPTIIPSGPFHTLCSYFSKKIATRYVLQLSLSYFLNFQIFRHNERRHM